MIEKVVGAFETRFPAGELWDRLHGFKSELGHALEVRNQFVHASWTFDHAKEETESRRLPKQAGAVEELRRMKVSDVEAAIESVGGVAERVWSHLYDPVAEATPDLKGEIVQIKVV